MHKRPVDWRTATSIFSRIAGPDPTPSLISRRKEAICLVSRAVRALDEDRRRVVDLRYGKDLPIEQIAKMTGKSPGAVKMLLNRAIKELRKRMVDDEDKFSFSA